MYVLRLPARLFRLLRCRPKSREPVTVHESHQPVLLSNNVTRFRLMQATVQVRCPYCGADPKYILRSKLRWYDCAVLCIVRGLRCGSCWQRFYGMRSWLRTSLEVFTALTEPRPVSKFSTPNASAVSLKTPDLKVQTHRRRSEKATA
jgi:hypothetical protein